MSLRIMLSKSVISGDAKLVEKLAKLADQIRRIQELKNTMDMGTLAVQASRAMEAVWNKLP